ncbi:hypothetical protein [Streptomyces sp. NPDC051014]|uniref:hypothetical protein n=1 Tax=Streptomyces sp. NPDC051014 TaxID=3155751 RepID=UPI00340AAACF
MDKTRYRSGSEFLSKGFGTPEWQRLQELAEKRGCLGSIMFLEAIYRQVGLAEIFENFIKEGGENSLSGDLTAEIRENPETATRSDYELVGEQVRLEIASGLRSEIKNLIMFS